ncbi:MAG: phenylalanine--tRNA ligase subunit alpha [Defluviitaleaceae bacterium]|nr:phenylalanine--tRNA ligase subunit alpha [Defluviitaleaceae bacterium]
MQNRLEEIYAQAQSDLKQITSLKALEQFKIGVFGKKGQVTALMKELGKLPKEERPAFGQKVHELQTKLEELMEQSRATIKKEELTAALERETIDITRPGQGFSLGRKHPLTTVMDEIKAIFFGMGYKVVEGPDIENAYYNFEALNINANHPARDESDTFHLGDYLLRTQTSPVQVRVLEKGNLPIKIIAPGRVYRPDEVDATHSPVFHQIEGLVVGEGVTMAHLKGNLLTFARELFGANVKIRFRPHHFPFTEPSAEMDISCFSCETGKSGCKVCRGEGYIELLGCGMVHPRVLEMSGVDPNIYTGFAFGMGLERLAMQRYTIGDLRLFYENDIRFLSQF